MKHTDVVLLSTSCIQSQLMRDFLSDLLHTPIRLATEQTLSIRQWEQSIILLVDMGNLPESEVAWEVQLHKFKDIIHTVILNTPENISAQSLLKWPNVKGYFTHSAKQDTLVKGLERILNDEYWISQEMLIEMVLHLQSLAQNSLPTIELTSREIDVLQHLSNGKDNTEIANTLFVSEHTIKSHLYKAYKKINVKNRVQAKRWAKYNLSSHT